MSTSTVRPRTTWLRPTAFGGILLVLSSIVVSATAYGMLASSIRIRWTVGTYYHYGPEYAPTMVVLASFPTLLAVLFVGFRWLRTRLERLDEFDDVQPVYELGVLAVFGMLLAVQITLIAFNIYL